MVVETGEKLHLLGTGAMVDGIVEDEHVDAIRLIQGSERGMNDGGGKLCREPAPVDSTRVHEAVERILAKRHSGPLEMHLRVGWNTMRKTSRQMLRTGTPRSLYAFAAQRMRLT